MERIRVVAAVVERDGELLICQRPSHKRHGGLWEFPGGKVEPAENDFAAIRRELREELDVEVVSVDEPAFQSDDEGSRFSIVFLPTIISGVPRALEHEQVTWASIDKLSEMSLAPTDRRYVAHRMSCRRDVPSAG